MSLKSSRRTVRVAIVGVGNCASALVQGVHKYRDASTDEFVPGLMHVDLGGYHVRDIEFVAAFDVDARKVGHDLSEAIFAEPNNTVRFAEVPPIGVTVSRGRTLDGIGQYLAEVVHEAPAADEDVAGSRGRGPSVLARETRRCGWPLDPVLSALLSLLTVAR